MPTSTDVECSRVDKDLVRRSRKAKANCCLRKVRVMIGILDVEPTPKLRRKG